MIAHWDAYSPVRPWYSGIEILATARAGVLISDSALSDAIEQVERAFRQDSRVTLGHAAARAIILECTRTPAGLSWRLMDQGELQALPWRDTPDRRPVANSAASPATAGNRSRKEL